jgi:hypothetical protein
MNKYKYTPLRKAESLVQDIRNNCSYWKSPVNEFDIDNINQVNILAIRTALIVTNEFIDSCYFWQVKRKLFFMAVKIHLYTLESLAIQNKQN